MSQKNYGILFRFCRFVFQRVTPYYQFSYKKQPSGPAVYVVHHQNLRGPLICFAWFPTPMRLWALSSLCSQKSCYRQYVDYTFTKRFSMPLLIAASLAFPLSFCVSKLLQSSRVIPVFRGSKDMAKTIRQSISALVNGESLLICPDVDYTDKSTNIGEIYEGFLSLESYYWKETGSHLAFIPLLVSTYKHCIFVQEPVYFKGKTHFKQEKIEVSEKIKQELCHLDRLEDI